VKRGILYTFLAQAPTLLLYFISSTLITRLLSDTGRGEYALLTSQVALLAMLTGLGLGHGITFYSAKGKQEMQRTIGGACTMFLITCTLLPVVLWLLAGSRTASDLLMPSGRESFFFWFFVYGSVVFALFDSSVSAVLLGLKKFKVLNGMGILNAALSALAFSLFYAFHDPTSQADTLVPVLVVMLSLRVIPSTCWLVLYRVHVGIAPVPYWSWAVIRPLLTFSLISYLTNLINLVNYRFDVWVVDQEHGTAALGLYAVAVGVGQLLFYVPEPFARVVQPFLYGQERDRMLGRYKAVARLNFTTMLVLAFSLGVVAEWLLPLLYGQVFSGSALALRLLLPGIVCSGATKLLIPLVVGQGFQHFNLAAVSVGAAFTVCLDLLLIPAWGIEGAAIASSISYCIILILVLLVIRFRAGIPIWDMFLLRRSDIALVRSGNLK
jgi:O-antigen/teichoic acid export membrane protein